jgi:hypothetical protein
MYDPTIGRFITEDPKGFAAGINFYAYVGNNPINHNDPTGMYTGVDDAIFAGGGGLIGVVGQGVSNWTTGKPIIPRDNSSWRDYTSAFVGGAVGGEALLYSPWMGPSGPFVAGGASGLATNATKQAWNWATTSNFSVDWASAAYDTTIGTLTGFIGGVKIPGLSAGRNSFNAIFNQMTTKFENGTISNLSTETALKMFAGKNTESATLPLAAGTSLASEVYDWGKGLLGTETPAATSTFFGGDSAAAGGYLIYPNKPNTNMMQSVYSK